MNDASEDQSPTFKKMVRALKDLDFQSEKRWSRHHDRAQTGQIQIDLGMDSLVFHLGPEIEKQNQGDF